MPPSLVTARVAACILGTALVVWGVAPTIIGYALRADAWQLHKLASGALPLGLGIAFISLASLATPRRAWPLWITLGLALVLAAANILALLSAGTAAHMSVFPLLLTCCTAGAAWIAIDMRRRAAANAVA